MMREQHWLSDGSSTAKTNSMMSITEIGGKNQTVFPDVTITARYSVRKEMQFAPGDNSNATSVSMVSLQ